MLAAASVLQHGFKALAMSQFVTRLTVTWEFVDGQTVPVQLWEALEQPPIEDLMPLTYSTLLSCLQLAQAFQLLESH